MPLYDFLCECGREQELPFHIDMCPECISCACGKTAKKVLSVGGIRTDNDVSWMESAVKVLQPDYERTIKTRTEYRKYLKDNRLEPIG